MPFASTATVATTVAPFENVTLPAVDFTPLTFDTSVSVLPYVMLPEESASDSVGINGTVVPVSVSETGAFAALETKLTASVTVPATFGLKVAVNERQGGKGWPKNWIGKLMGWYSGLVYLTPIIGGYLADRYLGTHRSLIIGGIKAFFVAAGADPVSP